MTTAKKPAAKPAAKKPVARKPAAKAAPAAAPAKAVQAATYAASGQFYAAVGRRKRGIAQVRLYPSGKGTVTVNDKPMAAYFPVDELQTEILQPLKAVGMDATADVTAKAQGGGIRGQAHAVRLGISRALLKMNADYRATLKPMGILTRDPREKERKKYGKLKARKSPQWAKR